MGEGRDGLLPRSNDFIITGRSFEEYDVTVKQLEFALMRPASEFVARLYTSPWRWDQKTRERSGSHKAYTLNMLLTMGHEIQIHFEDDPIQADIIKMCVPGIHVVLLTHNLTELENVKHDLLTEKK